MPQELESNVNVEEYTWFQYLLVRQAILWHRLWIITSQGVGWVEAGQQIDDYYKNKCIETGEANILYRPPQGPHEIGPQSRLEYYNTKIMDWVWAFIIILVLYKIFKKRNDEI